jgi:hypothetical protein
VPHHSAPVSETGRLRLSYRVVEDGWPLRRPVERLPVSVTTAARVAGCRSRILVVRCNRIVGYDKDVVQGQDRANEGIRWLKPLGQTARLT